MFGSRAAEVSGLERLFPGPAALANAPLERAGVATKAAEIVRSLARHAAEGTTSSRTALPGSAALAALEALPGIDRWTTQYIAMRALGEPDSFPAADAGPGDIESRSQRWRPWRAYAAVLLWQGAGEEGLHSRRKNAQKMDPRGNRRSTHERAARGGW
jgi:AraC family transcriptional regulator of adaptative response / DNA-3-methyladenine glycosylase II